MDAGTKELEELDVVGASEELDEESDEELDVVGDTDELDELDELDDEDELDEDDEVGHEITAAVTVLVMVAGFGVIIVEACTFTKNQ